MWYDMPASTPSTLTRIESKHQLLPRGTREVSSGPKCACEPFSLGLFRDCERTGKRPSPPRKNFGFLGQGSYGGKAIRRGCDWNLKCVSYGNDTRQPALILNQDPKMLCSKHQIKSIHTQSEKEVPQLPYTLKVSFRILCTQHIRNSK